MRDFKLIIIDEVHHAFGSKVYENLLKELEGTRIAGFTALLPSKKVKKGLLGIEPVHLVYDFKKLEELGGFECPNAIGDIYDSPMEEDERVCTLRSYKRFPRTSPSCLRVLWSKKSL
jgi:superfamily II DNA or RNA helicase